MSETWLPKAHKHDYRYANNRGGMNGPFTGQNPIGVAVHVNVSGKTSNGTSDEFFRDNSNQVLPNFQVFRDGSISQYTPMEWQSWCQVSGNPTFAAIETGGDPDMKYTKAQIESLGYLLAHYHKHFGIPLQITNSPYHPGIGTHSMGGVAWGGHSCPGTLRAGERGELIKSAKRYLKPVKIKWTTLLRHGSRGPAVRELQEKLIQKGFVEHPTSNWADGYFGHQTVAAVKRAKHHYKWYNRFGVVGHGFWNKLFETKKK